MPSRLLSACLVALLAACDGAGQAPGTTESAATHSAVASQSLLTVYKSPSCGCCGDWVAHIEQRGFRAEVQHPADLNAIKQQYGLAPRYQSCHTAVSAQGYIFEGHIPAHLMQRFLQQPPAQARGLVVPAMPVGSPGMEMGDHFRPYEVLLLKTDGSTELYATVQRREEQY